MKNILTGLIVCCLSLITSNINGQPTCTEAQNVVAEYSNVFCNAMSNELTFDLTLTNDGMEIVTASGSLVFDDASGNNIGSNSIIAETTITDYPITINDPNCDIDISSMNVFLRFQDGSGRSFPCNAALSAAPATVAVPTLGEWGLIVLFLSLMIMGLVAIRDPSFLARKAI